MDRGTLGLEFDYRIHWLRSHLGRDLAVMVNVVDTAVSETSIRAPERRTDPGRSTACTLWVHDVESGTTWSATAEGEVDAAFRFQAGSSPANGALGWRTGADESHAHVDIRAPGLELSLKARSLAGRSRFHDPGRERGIIDNGPLGRAHYVVMTRLWHRGELTLDGVKHRVRGYGWRDRHWMHVRLDGRAMGYAWRWFAIQLDQPARVFMAYELWDPVTGRAIKSYASAADESGHPRPTLPTDVVVRVLEVKEHRGRRFETRWRVRSLALDLDIELERIGAQPWVHADTKLVTHDYAEGPCTIYGVRSPGRAWAEQVSSLWLTPRAR